MEQQTVGGWRSLSKRNAFLIHLALSILVFMTLVMLMVTLWFPGELFFLDGGWQGLKLVAVVDIVLGPALTLLLWRPNKKDLVMDMSLIALIQIAALAYGFVTTYQQRTAALVFAENSFKTQSQADHITSNQKLIDADIVAQSIVDIDDRKPAILVANIEVYGFAQYLADVFNNLPELYERSDLYEHAKDHFEQIRKHAVSDETLAEEDPEGLVEAAIAKQEDMTSINVYRFNARYGSGFVLYDSSTANIVDFIKIEKTQPEEEAAE